MIPKQKANELFEKMLSTDKIDSYSFVSLNVAKQCALICCDEILNSSPNDPYPGGYYETEKDRIDSCIFYWQKVKQEIINL